jgi:membrane protease YdiL (CAAX protease family)
VPSWLDHTFVLLFAVVFPLWTWLFWMPHVFPRLQAGEQGLRIRIYRTAMLEQWPMAAAAVALWAVPGRSLEALGLRLEPTWPFAAGLAFCALFALLMIAQVRAVRSSPETQEALRGQLHGMAEAIMPRTPAERRGFQFVSITAGVCEEVLFRGFLVAYLMYGMGLWPAIAVSSILFGLAHVYLGPGHILKTTIAGAAFGASYGLTGHLAVPVLLHALMDLGSGAAASVALEERSASADEPAILETS